MLKNPISNDGMNTMQPFWTQTKHKESRYIARIDIDDVRKGEIVQKDHETQKYSVVEGLLSPRHIRFITEEAYNKVAQAFYPPGYLENAAKWLDKV